MTTKTQAYSIALYTSNLCSFTIGGPLSLELSSTCNLSLLEQVDICMFIMKSSINVRWLQVGACQCNNIGIAFKYSSNITRCKLRTLVSMHAFAFFLFLNAHTCLHSCVKVFADSLAFQNIHFNMYPIHSNSVGSLKSQFSETPTPMMLCQIRVIESEKATRRKNI